MKGAYDDCTGGTPYLGEGWAGMIIKVIPTVNRSYKQSLNQRVPLTSHKSRPSFLAWRLPVAPHHRWISNMPLTVQSYAMIQHESRYPLDVNPPYRCATASDQLHGKATAAQRSHNPQAPSARTLFSASIYVRMVVSIGPSKR